MYTAYTWALCPAMNARAIKVLALQIQHGRSPKYRLLWNQQVGFVFLLLIILRAARSNRKMAWFPSCARAIAHVDAICYIHCIVFQHIYTSVYICISRGVACSIRRYDCIWWRVFCWRVAETPGILIDSSRHLMSRFFNKVYLHAQVYSTTCIADFCRPPLLGNIQSSNQQRITNL